MNDIEISDLIKEWITHKINNPKYKIEEFILDKYIDIKKSSTDNIEELKKSFLKRIDIWKENSYDFEEFVGKQNLYISASQEQSSEMLDNVINELDMDIKEQYHYMSNIKMLIYSSMVEKLDDSLKSEISNILEENYNNEWEMADEGVSEKELQDMFSETAYLLSYIGVDYSSQTRKILAEIGVGHSAYFENEISGEYRNDICILTNFIVSEMVLNDEKFECTEYEKRDIVEKVIPVCVSSMSMAENETDDNNYIKIANQEPIFIPVKSKFQMPIIDEEDIKERQTTYTKKELKAKEHLDKTYNVVGKLNIYKIKPNIKSKTYENLKNEKERE